MSHILQLSQEVILNILNYLYIEDIQEFCLTCKLFREYCLMYSYPLPLQLPISKKIYCEILVKTVRQMEINNPIMDIGFNWLYKVFSHFRNLREVQVTIKKLPKQTKLLLFKILKDFNNIKVLSVPNQELVIWRKLKKTLNPIKVSPLIKKDLLLSKVPQLEDEKYNFLINEFNNFVASSVKRYENGNLLNNFVEALSLNNIMFLSKSKQHYDSIDEVVWTEFIADYKVSYVDVDLTAQEDKMIKASLLPNSKKFRHMEDNLNSDRIMAIFDFLSNYMKLTIDNNENEEDILLADFVDPLVIKPFLKSIQNIKIHGNGYTLRESTIRKIKSAKKYGHVTKGIKGRIPDRSLEYQLPLNKKKFNIMVCEVKTMAKSRKQFDLVKLSSMMKDMYDSAVEEGVRKYHITGLLIEGINCTIYTLHMPIPKLYCLTEIKKIEVPHKTDKDVLEKLQNAIKSILVCRDLISSSIISLQEMSVETVKNTHYVDSYPSPLHHYEYYK